MPLLIHSDVSIGNWQRVIAVSSIRWERMSDVTSLIDSILHGRNFINWLRTITPAFEWTYHLIALLRQLIQIWPSFLLIRWDFSISYLPIRWILSGRNLCTTEIDRLSLDFYTRAWYGKFKMTKMWVAMDDISMISNWNRCFKRLSVPAGLNPIFSKAGSWKPIEGRSINLLLILIQEHDTENSKLQSYKPPFIKI